MSRALMVTGALGAGGWLARPAERPALDRAQPSHTETATFAVGCFWSVDSRFGSVPGVVRSRCGYAGGSASSPTYHNLEGNVESVQVDYDPARTSYPKLVDVFFLHHPCTRTDVPRSHPILFWANEAQRREADRAVAERARALGFQPAVAVRPLASFTVAEDEHQKYHLRQSPTLWADFERHYPSDPAGLLASTAAMRINSYLGGFGNRRELLAEMPGLGLSRDAARELTEAVNAP